MIEWLSMGGYGFYVWSAYGMLALAVVIELLVLRRRRASAHEGLRQIIEEESA